MARCRHLVESSVSQLRAYWPQPTGDSKVIATDSVRPTARLMVQTAKLKLGNLDVWAKRMTGLAVESNRDSVDKRLGSAIENAIGIDVSSILRSNGAILQTMATATRDNVALIKSIPDQYFDRVFATVTDGWTQGIRWESMVEQIQRDGDITENRAKLIARDQTSKMNAAFNQERQQQVGIERFEWSTSEDERVRESHAEIDGQVFSWDDPPIVDDEPAVPGKPINCRCVAIPVIDMDTVAGAQGAEEEAA